MSCEDDGWGGVWVDKNPRELTPLEKHMARCDQCAERGIFRDKPAPMCPTGLQLYHEEESVYPRPEPPV